MQRFAFLRIERTWSALLRRFVLLFPAPRQPGFQGGQRGLMLDLGGPDRLAVLQADLVLALALALGRAAKVRQVGDPQDAIERNVLVVDLCRGRPFVPSPFTTLPTPRTAASRPRRRPSARPAAPPTSSACRPAIVVPPGLATRSLSTPGCSPVSSTISAPPSTVCAASCVAMPRGRPIRTPPSLRASIITYTNAGPEPDSPVTASSSFSSTSTAMPTDWSNCLTSSAVVRRGAGRPGNSRTPRARPGRACWA